MKRAGFLMLGLILSALAGCSSSSPRAPCEGVDCSGNGRCIDAGNNTAACVCNAGFVSNGMLECVPVAGGDPVGGDPQGGDSTSGDPVGGGDQAMGDTAGGDNPMGDSAGGDTIGGDAGMCPSTTNVSVSPVFTAADWNTYVQRPVGATSPLAVSESICNIAGSESYYECYHAGQTRQVVTTATSCEGLRAEDDLGVFEWRCDPSTNPSVMYTVTFRPNRGLEHLITSTAWRDNAVTVYQDDCVLHTTPATAWWTNPVTPVPDNSTGDAVTLATEGTIYTLNTSRQTPGYNLDANGVALVTLDGAILSYNGDTRSNCVSGELAIGAVGPGTVICTGGQSRLWVEARVYGEALSNQSTILIANSTKMSRVHRTHLAGSPSWNMQIQNSSASIALTSSSINDNGNFDGLSISSSAARFVLLDTHFGSGTDDTLLALSQSTVLQGVFVSNSQGRGANLGVDYIVTTLSTAAFNTGNGFDSAANQVFQSVTALQGSNNGILSSTSNTVVNALAVSNDHNIRADGQSQELSHIAVTDGDDGLILEDAANSLVLPTLYIGGNSADCVLFGNNASATFDASCNHGVGLTSTPTTLGSRVGAIVGPVLTDAVNLDVGPGARAANQILDWGNFENRFRSWGPSPAAPFPSGANRGRCSGTDLCQIWDFRLKDDTTVFSNLHGTFDADAACPDSVNPNTADNTRLGRAPVTQTFLTFAVEIVGDYWGNEDGLCESNERCLFTPNVGAYQGEGELVGPCSFTNSAAVRDVLLYAYEQNGAETVVP